ncbi:MAG: PAS domain S-box protein [Proteobacteria bacterium]|nr:PAS domain S-box protein [Pseudomonadota bacterium]
MIPRQFWADITKNIDGLYRLMHQYIVPALTIHLNNRIEQASITLNTVIIIAIFLFLLSLYFMIALYKALLSNIVHISETINYFSQGKLDSRIKLSTDDEMRDISIAINDMANKLEKSQKLVAFQQKVLDEHAIVSITDVKGNITYCNDKFEKISQYSKNELIGQNHRILKTDEHPDSVFKEMWKTIANGKVWHGEVKNKAKDGSFYWVSATIAPYLNEQGKPQQYLSIRTDISHIKKLETKQIEVNKLLLAEKLLTEHEKQKAEKANQAKSEFLSSMSHELRTPLNAILGFAQVLEYDDTLDNEQQDSVDEIIKGGNHLLVLINQVLDLAKIESGHIELKVESVKLTDVLNECYSLMNPVASQYKICINYIDIGDYYVQADKTRLKQVLLNLLNNAIKYNHPYGNVELRVSPANNKLKITISDTGYGIAEKYLDNLFQPFNRLDAEGGDIEGTGIGLAITRNLVEIMNGQIGVNSQLNVGSQFWFELPRAYEKN